MTKPLKWVWMRWKYNSGQWSKWHATEPMELFNDEIIFIGGHGESLLYMRNQRVMEFTADTPDEKDVARSAGGK